MWGFFIENLEKRILDENHFLELRVFEEPLKSPLVSWAMTLVARR